MRSIILAALSGSVASVFIIGAGVKAAERDLDGFIAMTVLSVVFVTYYGIEFSRAFREFCR